MPIDTLANVKLQLHIATGDKDGLLDALRAAADSYIENYCHRDFEGGSFSEDHPAGSRLIFLKNYPLDAVTSVNVDANRTFTPATVLDASRYTIHADRGVIESLDGPFLGSRNGNAFPNAVRVEYTTPTDEVPDAIKRAYAELVGHWLRESVTFNATGQQNLLKITNGSEVTKYPWGQSGGYSLPPGVQQLLNQYRAPGLS